MSRVPVVRTPSYTHLVRDDAHTDENGGARKQLRTATWTDGNTRRATARRPRKGESKDRTPYALERDGHVTVNRHTWARGRELPKTHRVDNRDRPRLCRCRRLRVGDNEAHTERGSLLVTFNFSHCSRITCVQTSNCPFRRACKFFRFKNCEALRFG
jgi:Ni/Co efflux regulator RcnB